MKRVLLLLCLIGAAVPPVSAQSTEQDELPAVVVDMPKIISLSYASPDTWGDLPMPVRPYDDQLPAIGPAQQLAMSLPN
jgi:hypothetical protein